MKELEEEKLSKDHIERTKRKIEVMQAYVDGEKVEKRANLHDAWFICEYPLFNLDGFYRIAKTPDTINWGHVAPEFKYMARDQDGFAYFHIDKPVINIDYWIKGYKASVGTQSSYRKGTVDWKESLVIRPGVE